MRQNKITIYMFNIISKYLFKITPLDDMHEIFFSSAIFLIGELPQILFFDLSKWTICVHYQVSSFNNLENRG